MSALNRIIVVKIPQTYSEKRRKKGIGGRGIRHKRGRKRVRTTQKIPHVHRIVDTPMEFIIFCEIVYSNAQCFLLPIHGVRHGDIGHVPCN